jgi:hypothetical protein
MPDSKRVPTWIALLAIGATIIAEIAAFIVLDDDGPADPETQPLIVVGLTMGDDVLRITYTAPGGGYGEWERRDGRVYSNDIQCWESAVVGEALPECARRDTYLDEPFSDFLDPTPSPE